MIDRSDDFPSRYSGSGVEASAKKGSRVMDIGKEISQKTRESIAQPSSLNLPMNADLSGSELNSLVESRLQIKQMKELNPLSPAELSKKKIIHPEMKEKQVINKFRSLRTKLFGHDFRNNSVVLVCTTHEGGGSTFFAINLAAAIALEESKTSLLIDCNLNNPSITETFGLKGEVGLTDYLEDPNVDLEKIIYPSGISRYRVIPVGTSLESSSEFFTSVRMRQLLQLARERYSDRYVILDTPPVLGSADTSILAPLCNKLLVVAPYGEVSEDDFSRTIETVGPERVTGVILNEKLI